MEWISVEERLPEDPNPEHGYGGKYYLVAIQTGDNLDTAYMRWSKAVIRGKQTIGWEWRGRIPLWEVTHWMPLPEPPCQSARD